MVRRVVYIQSALLSWFAPGRPSFIAFGDDVLGVCVVTVVPACGWHVSAARQVDTRPSGGLSTPAERCHVLKADGRHTYQH